MGKVRWRTVTLPRVCVVLAGLALLGSWVALYTYRAPDPEYHALQPQGAPAKQRLPFDSGALDPAALYPAASDLTPSAKVSSSQISAGENQAVGRALEPSNIGSSNRGRVRGRGVPTYLPWLESTSNGATFEIRGEARGLPDGTVVHCELHTKPEFGSPARIALVKLEVNGGRYEGTWDWPSKALEPGIYESTVTLFQSKQTAAIRLLLHADRGWSEEHVERLEVATLKVGSEQEQRESRRRALEELLEFLSTFDELLATGTRHSARDPYATGARSSLEVLHMRIRTHYRCLRDREERVVVSFEQGTFRQLVGLYSGLTDALRGHSKGGNFRTQLEALKKNCERVRATLEERLAKQDHYSAASPNGER